MLLHVTFAGRRSPAAKFLLAACGIAGCAGPNVSASAETSSALVRSEGRALAAGAAAGRVHMTYVDPRSIASRPVWVAGAQSIPTENPFAVTRGTARPTTPGVARRAAAPSVHRVAYAQPTGAAAMRPSSEATGVARVNDRRLPPAAPLGGANPFAKSDVAATTTPTDAPPVIARYADTTPAAQTPLPERRVSFRGEDRREEESRAPMPTFLSANGSGDGVTAGKVRHEDMIVDSSILPKRPEILPQLGNASPVDYTITPRRPFTSSTRDEADATSPTATANIPIAITPSRRIEARPVSLSSPSSGTASDVPAAAIVSIPEPSAEPAESSDPFAGLDAPGAEESTETAEAPAPPADEPIFAAEEPAFVADEPVFAADAPEELPETDAPPLLAPGPTLMAAVTPTAPAPAPPAAATTVQEEPSRLAEHSGVTEVRGVEVEGDQAAARQAASRSTALNAPVTVGLVLAAVAIGAVLVRRRFS